MEEIKTKNDFGVIFWLHLLLITVSYLSPLWLDWKAIFAGAILLQIYYYFRGGCDVTFWEFGREKDMTFSWYYLQKIFPNLDKKKTKLFLDHYLSAILILSSFISQVIFSFKPLVNF